MNLLLLFPEDFITPARARISGRRGRHLVEVLRTTPGQAIRVGLLNGLLGAACVISQSAEHVDLAVQLTTPPPPPAPLTLLLALPRPKVLRRILQGVTACGVKRLVLLNTARVDKSYWQSPFLTAAALQEQLLLGLEQGRDTRLPEVLLRPRFRPFVEDELPAVTAGSLRLLAHPESARPCPCAVGEPVTLAVGPEGGFVPFEVDLLATQGFLPIHLGSRPLRVETAVPALIGRLLPL
jgi:16S rRNA (uracil1498-N3)-methyltransferase